MCQDKLHDHLVEYSPNPLSFCPEIIARQYFPYSFLVRHGVKLGSDKWGIDGCELCHLHAWPLRTSHIVLHCLLLDIHQWPVNLEGHMKMALHLSDWIIE